MKETEKPARQAATERATAMWVLPTPGGPSRAALALGLDEGEGRQVFDLPGIELGLKREVVLVECLVVRQLGQPQALSEAPVVTNGEFLGQDQVEKVEVAHFGLVCPAGVLVQALCQVGQAELGGCAADSSADQLAQLGSSGVGWVVKGRVPVSSS